MLNRRLIHLSVGIMAAMTVQACKSSNASRPSPKGPTTEKEVEPIDDSKSNEQTQPQKSVTPSITLPREGGDLDTHWKSFGKGQKITFKKAVSDSESTVLIWNYKYAVYIQENRPVNWNPLSDEGKKLSQDYCKVSFNERNKEIQKSEVLFIDEVKFNDPESFLGDKTKGSVEFIATDGGKISKIKCHKYGSEGKIYIQDVLRQMGEYISITKI